MQDIRITGRQENKKMNCKLKNAAHLSAEGGPYAVGYTWANSIASLNSNLLTRIRTLDSTRPDLMGQTKGGGEGQY